MSDTQQKEYRYNDILSGVNIDENTFHIKADHQKGTLAIIDDTVDKLYKFISNDSVISDSKFRNIVSRNISILWRTKCDIEYGTYFSAWRCTVY